MKKSSWRSLITYLLIWLVVVPTAVYTLWYFNQETMNDPTQIFRSKQPKGTDKGTVKTTVDPGLVSVEVNRPAERGH